MSVLLERAARRYQAGVQPPPPMSPSEWGQKHYVITKGPGTGKPWSPKGGWEFQIGILDALYGPLEPGEEVREAVLFKGSKAGCTLLCDIGSQYQVAWQRRSAAIVAPRKPDSADRAADAERVILASKSLRAVYQTYKGRTKQAYSGAQLIFRSGETERDLIDWGAPVITGDERDRWARLEGDQDAMLAKRQGGYAERLMVWLSTPTIPRYGVHQLFLDSDQRAYHVRCPLPGCGEWQVLRWQDDDGDGSVVWDENATTFDAKVKSARFICLKCGKTWSRHMRAVANATGEWVAAKPGVDRLGFEISRLYVPTALPREFVTDWLKGQDDPKILREFWNQLMARAWINALGNLDENALQRVISSEVEWGKPPSGYTRLFAGVDTQDTDNRCYYPWEVRAYNETGLCALIAYGIAYSPEELSSVLNDTYGKLRVERALIDITDGQHTSHVESLVSDIPCLEAARFDPQSRVAFQRYKREQPGEKKEQGMGGWAVKREEALDDLMTRFFEQGKSPPTIRVARNSQAGREKEWIQHYTRLKRTRLEIGRNRVIFTYEKPQVGCDYPFAGALAEIARRMGASEMPGDAVFETRQKTPSAPPPPLQPNQDNSGLSEGVVRVVGGGPSRPRRRF